MDGHWKVAARSRGPHRVSLAARSGEGHRWREELTLDESSSPTEVVLLGLARALSYVRGRGATVVKVVVTDATLDGLLHRGWQPRSTGVVRGLRALVDAAEGLHIEFVTRLPGRRPRR